MNGPTIETVTAAKREICVLRRIDAPRSRVFEAWTKPEKLVCWWAPAGYATLSCSVDLRVGGVFHYCMRSSEGKDIWGAGVYREVRAPGRLVYIDSFADADARPTSPWRNGRRGGCPVESIVAVDLDEQEGGTALVLRHTLVSPAHEQHRSRRAWNEMLDRLTTHVTCR